MGPAITITSFYTVIDFSWGFCAPSCLYSEYTHHYKDEDFGLIYTNQDSPDVYHVTEIELIPNSNCTNNWQEFADQIW